MVTALDGHLPRKRGDDVDMLDELEAEVGDHIRTAVDVVA